MRAGGAPAPTKVSIRGCCQHVMGKCWFMGWSVNLQSGEETARVFVVMSKQQLGMRECLSVFKWCKDDDNPSTSENTEQATSR